MNSLVLLVVASCFVALIVSFPTHHANSTGKVTFNTDSDSNEPEQGRKILQNSSSEQSQGVTDTQHLLPESEDDGEVKNLTKRHCKKCGRGGGGGYGVLLVPVAVKGGGGKRKGGGCGGCGGGGGGGGSFSFSQSSSSSFSGSFGKK